MGVVRIWICTVCMHWVKIWGIIMAHGTYLDMYCTYCMYAWVKDLGNYYSPWHRFKRHLLPLKVSRANVIVFKDIFSFCDIFKWFFKGVS